MIHPLFQVIAREPDLITEHVGAYAGLVATEIEKTASYWKSRVVLHATALILLTVSIIFTGVALMLWALVPLANMNLPWLLVLVPLAFLLVGGVCASIARAEPKSPAFDALKQQVSADLAMLREVSAS